MKRTKAAFLLNCGELGPKLYFWTFTFRKLLDLPTARKEWNKFLTLARKWLPSMQGLRVFEMHERHGLHVHVVTTRFINVDHVRSVLNRQKDRQIGRIHVERAEPSIAPYLGKYLSKDREKCLKGWRLWAALDSKSYAHTRVADVIIESLLSSVWAATTAAFRWKGNKQFHRKRSIVFRLHQLCVVFDVEPGFFPSGPWGQGGVWDDRNDSFRNWFCHGIRWVLSQCPKRGKCIELAAD